MGHTLNFLLRIGETSGADAVKSLAKFKGLNHTEPQITQRVYASTDSRWTISVSGSEEVVKEFIQEAKEMVRCR